MIPCAGCAYRESIPGDTHIRCRFAWGPDQAFIAMFDGVHLTARTAHWFRFPFNYDPLWGPDTCPMRAETRDSTQVAPPNALADILSLLR